MIGCFTESVVFNDNPSLDLSKPMNVGDSTTGAYVFALAVSSRSWCSTELTEIIQTNGNAWSGTIRLSGSGSQPYTTYDLNSNTDVYSGETINFKVKSTFTNQMTFNSADLSIVITCTNTYTIS